MQTNDIQENSKTQSAIPDVAPVAVSPSSSPEIPIQPPSPQSNSSVYSPPVENEIKSSSRNILRKLVIVIPLVLIVGGAVFFGRTLYSSFMGMFIPATQTSTDSNSKSTKPAETNPGGIRTASWTAYSDKASSINFRLPGKLLTNDATILVNGLSVVSYEASYQGRTVASVIIISDPSNALPVTKQSILDFEAAKYNSRLKLSANSRVPKNFEISAESGAVALNKPAYIATGETMFTSPSSQDGLLIDQFSGEIISIGQYKVIVEAHGTDAEPSTSIPLREAILTTVKSGNN